MHKVVLALIATSASICIKADDDVEIYEIRKTVPSLKAFDLDSEVPNVEIGDQYYGNEEIDGIKSKYDAQGALDNREDVDIFANSLIKELRSIANSKQYNQDMAADNDYISSYSDLRDDSVFRNIDRTPLIFVANKNILYHINPHSFKTRNVQNKLQSILRSINNDNEVEDRTAPPFKKIRYDYEYD